MQPTRFFALAALLGSAALLPAQLAGTYTVGPGGNYANIAAAISALTTNGVVAPVTFQVTANDVGPWSIGAFAGQGVANPVEFAAIGTITLSGGQPLFTLNGCASVTISGFSGTPSATPSVFVVAGATADCTFRGLDFVAPTTTSTASGQAVFSLTGGSGTRIEDCRFGGSYEALNSATANTTTTVERCRITGGGFWIMRISGSDFTLRNNYITGTSNYGISCGVSGTPAGAANLKIHHNSIYIQHSSTGSQFCTLRWYSNAPGTEVLNNILWDDFVGNSGFNMWCSGSYRPAVMNYNCLHSNVPGYFPIYASTSQTFAAWQGLGFDVNSIQGDPLFTNASASPPDLSLQGASPCATAGTFLPTVLTDFSLAPRTPAVSIGADEEDGSGASYTVFGAGCPGTAGIPSNTMSAPPQLGTSPLITVGNLPAPNLAFLILGLSNTTSAFGPLPIDLTLLGAPGCNARVALDVLQALTGAAGSASVPFNVPNQTFLIGFTFHTQALVLDPPLNAFGFSISDAATATVGL